MQDNLIIYNGYHPEFFHHDLTKKEVRTMKTLTIESFEKQRNRYFQLTNKLADRCLVNIKNNSFVITAEPVNKFILKEITNIYGFDIESMHFEHLLSDHPEDLAITILGNSKLMDKLRKWARKASNPILNPRTISEGSIQLAQELKINHSLIMPPNMKRIVKGIYPSMKYIKKHSIKENNSKVKNYLLLKEVEKDKKCKFVPDGGVAFDLDKICDIACRLAKKGKKVLIKADLSMSGAGNVVLDTLEKRNGKSYIDLPREKQKSIVLKLLKDKVIPLSKKTGVVVNEYLDDVLYTFGYEVFSYPHSWKATPKITFSCGIFIDNGGYDGCYIPDPLELNNLKTRSNTILSEYNISSLLSKRKKEYKLLITKLKITFLKFIESKWKEGYVGICDCDIGIFIDKKGELSAKIFEFNYSRENGGTYPYILFKKLKISNLILQNSLIISRDKLRGTLTELTPNKIIRHLKSNNIYFSKNIGGIILLGHKKYEQDSHISYVSIASSLEKAMKYNNILQNLINTKNL